MKSLIKIIFGLFFLSTICLAEDRRVIIVNNTHVIMESLYASNVDRRNWEEDILGVGVLFPGKYITVNIYDGTYHCRYDLKAVFADGEVVVKNNMDVCSAEVWRISD
jgi:hypothetical protein